MSHRTGRLVSIAPIRIGSDGSSMSHDFTPEPALMGGPPLFVILHFTAMNIPAGAALVVNLGYDQDRFDSTTGPQAWTRPIDPSAGPIHIEYVGGGSGGVTLAEYGSGEPTITGTPGVASGNQTNADVFLQTDPYQEPIYEVRARCGATFDWLNAACTPSGSPEREASHAVCMLIMIHDGELSTCSGTLIQPDLVITAGHCVNSADGIGVASGSVTFDFATTCAEPGRRPSGFAPRFHKIREVVRRGTADWTLLRIDTPAGGLGITPRPLRGSALMPGETIHAIHHPNGAAKKWQSGVLGASGTTVSGFDVAGGSSGSALFDALGRVIGAAASTAGPCSVTYVSSAQVLAELASTPAPPTPFDIALVIDNSGSMGGPGTTTAGVTKMTEAQRAASLFVQLMRSGAGDRLGLVSFTTTATLRTPLAAVEAGHKTMLVGPAPFTDGTVGALAPDAMTSIGHGLQVAVDAFPASTNQRGIVLLTDGLQNTPPMLETVEGGLGDTRLFVVGFGEEWQLNGPLLTRLAREHRGFYTRAQSGLELMKFFTLAFGNIFEAGMLSDPERVLGAQQVHDEEVPFQVCEEERITAVIGWDDPTQLVNLTLTAPSGAVITPQTAGIEATRGQTWLFLRISLPFVGEREGTWTWQVSREVPPGVEFISQPGALRYFFSVVADGGPRLTPLRTTRRVYTGDSLNPLVALRYPDGTVPHGSVQLTVHAPAAALGQVVLDAGLDAPEIDGDPVDAFRATLQRLARTGALQFPTRSVTVPLFDDGEHEDGAMEHDGIHGDVLHDFTRFEGTYTFHAKATIGEECIATREAFWSLSVEPSVDAGQTDVRLVQGSIPGTGTLVFTPRDRFGNPLGPGRLDLFEVLSQSGTNIDRPVQDNRDGSYEVAVSWDGTTTEPGILIGQPERAAVPVRPPATSTSRRHWFLLFWIVLLLLLIALLVIIWLVLR